MKDSGSLPVIPFVKPERIGNFKVWRSKFQISVDPSDDERKKVANESNGTRKVKSRRVDVECINISFLDGSFSVRIPQTFEMFGMLTVAYQWSKSDNAEERKRGLDFLRTAMSNIFYVSSICNGFYHHGVEMLTSAYADPSVLRDTENGRAFIEDVKGTVSRFLSWREEFDKHVSASEPTEQDIRQEELAEKAADILSGDQ